MAGERLHEFDLDLCDYVLGNIRAHLCRLPHRPRPPLPELEYGEFDRLTLPRWLGLGVASLPEPLADHVWAGVTGEKVLLPLNDAELYALEGCVDYPPMRRERECVWVPFEGLHRLYVESVPDIRASLTPTTAEEWAADSVGLAARLCEDGLPLADGIEIVHEWLWCVRRLLRVMGASEYLPAPKGFHPTPTVPRPGTALPDGLDLGDERVADAVRELRSAIAELPDGTHAKPGAVIRKAGVQNQLGRNVLRYLQALGEYRGFGRKRPPRYRPGQ